MEFQINVPGFKIEDFHYLQERIRKESGVPDFIGVVGNGELLTAEVMIGQVVDDEYQARELTAEEIAKIQTVIDSFDPAASQTDRDQKDQQIENEKLSLADLGAKIDTEVAWLDQQIPLLAEMSNAERLVYLARIGRETQSILRAMKFIVRRMS